MVENLQTYKSYFREGIALIIVRIKEGFLGVCSVKNRSLLEVSEDFEHKHNDKSTLYTCYYLQNCF